MPDYEVNHVLLSPGPTGKVDPAKVVKERKVFKPGEIVSEEELTAAGFDIDTLRTQKEYGDSKFSASITPVRRAASSAPVARPGLITSPSTDMTPPPADMMPPPADKSKV